MTITVVVAEDEALVRAGCVMLLNAAPDIEVIGQAATAPRRWSSPTRCSPTSC